MKKTKLVQGIGINDYNGKVLVNGKAINSYAVWRSMLCRCYSSYYHGEKPTYIGCSVCDEWKYFTNFKNWYDENYVEGFVLDKDILIEGNKVYSADTCRFVPPYLNSLLTDHRNARGEFPIGVRPQKVSSVFGRVNESYQANCSNGYGKQLTKTFKSVEEASVWYSETKQRIVKEQATRAFLENAIKTDIYLALVRRRF